MLRWTASSRLVLVRKDMEAVIYMEIRRSEKNKLFPSQDIHNTDKKKLESTDMMTTASDKRTNHVSVELWWALAPKIPHVYSQKRWRQTGAINVNVSYIFLKLLESLRSEIYV